MSRDRVLDAAIVELESELPIVLPTISIAENVSVGDACYRLGYGQTNTLTWSGGKVQSFERDDRWVYTSSRIRSGDSGGPLFLADGSLVGNVHSAPGWHGYRGPINSPVSAAVACRPLRRFLGPLLDRLRCDPPEQTEPLPAPNPPIVPGPEIDYPRLVDLLVERMAADPRFQGPAGEVGPAGQDGEPGRDGTEGVGSVGDTGPVGPVGPAGSLPMGDDELKALADKLGPLLPPFYVRFEDDKTGSNDVRPVHLNRDEPDLITIRSPLPE